MALDQLDAQSVLGLPPNGLLAQFNRAGVLMAADVHVASMLARLGRDGDELVGLAAALAVRAPRVGHVLADLATVRETATSDAEDEADLSGLPWPALELWAEHVASSPAVSVGDSGPDDRPLRLVGTGLYLDRYWRDEVSVARDLIARSSAEPLGAAEAVLSDGLARLFQDDSGGLQRTAAEIAVRRHFSVIAGGPGTGKTTTVARLLALLEEQAAVSGGRPLRVALAAPTGKAAARMAEAVHAEGRKLDVGDEVRARLPTLGASTVHRLLGRHPASANRFRHNRDNRLPHDVVIVDETSMMSLTLMARLLEAVREDARLVLLGDQEQLASVEAGAVLGDIVGPAAAGLPATAGASPVVECITVLKTNHRFRGPLAELASAVRAGDEEAVLAALSEGTAGSAGPEAPSSTRWLALDVGSAEDPALEPVRSAASTSGRLLAEAGRRGDGPGALDALGKLRLLCAHRAGPAGASTWNAHVEQWLADGLSSSESVWYVGRPVIVTQNDYTLGLFNGDTGVVIARPDGGLTVVFRRGAEIVRVSPSRLAAVETAFAMTAHRAQGSEFDEVVVLLPHASSRILTRELLYTAVTRARRSVVLVGSEESVRAAVSRPIARASGLTARLWPGYGA
ncbi:MAG TPA: exodeoxyribonuclease V subunit alpha [Acidimicrobiales bacterium]|nr:exodeoxyribonuclease V subunit alpha [Acidimicrobiales bacterium]